MLSLLGFELNNTSRSYTAPSFWKGFIMRSFKIFPFLNPVPRGNPEGEKSPNTMNPRRGILFFSSQSQRVSNLTA